MKFLPFIHSPADLKKIKREELPKVCCEIRERIIEVVSKNGGHLGSSLGATDIITALHYVYNAPQDKIIFDTGHQTYAHKIITGRNCAFDTIRTHGGLSGFLKISESPYDAFGAGHASTALSAALGFAAARDNKKEYHKVVAVVSDGCMTGGMAYEALQNAGQIGSDILVILNDNQMFISHRVGALGTFLTKQLSKDKIQKAEVKIESFLKRFKLWGAAFVRVAKRAKVIFFPGMLFEEMGFTYLGPADGHNVVKLADILERAKELKGPVLLHLVTKKGKGCEQAEGNPIEYHGIGVFDKMHSEQSVRALAKTKAPSYTKVFSNAIVRLANADEKVVAITAAMPEGTGLDVFRDKFPSRYYDVGIAEEHAATFAAGLAAQGLKPVVAVYSSFAQRCYDQILHDICLQNLPVVFCLDRAGIVGEDGPTHHGVFDYSFLRHIPNLTILAPADENQLQNCLKTALSLHKPCIVRYPRGEGEGTPLDNEFRVLEYGKAEIIKLGKNANIIAAGNRVHQAVKAAEMLSAEGIDCGVINALFVKPFDEEAILSAVKSADKIVTIEDNVLAGGFGSAIAEFLCDKNINAKLLRLGIGDIFVEHGKQATLYEMLGLNAAKIKERIKNWI